MKKTVFAALAVFFCLAPLAQATPILPCPIASLSTYLNLAGGNCLIGSYIVSGFSSNVALPGQVTLTPIIGSSSGLTVQDTRNTSTIEVLSFSFGVGSGSTVLGGQKNSSSASGAGGVSMQDISFVKNVNLATPKLLQTCATGQHLPVPNLICGGTPTTASTIYPFAATSVDVTLSLSLLPDASGALGTGTHTIAFVPVPEPGTMLLLASGAILFVRRIGKKRSRCGFASTS